MGPWITLMTLHSRDSSSEHIGHSTDMGCAGRVAWSIPGLGSVVTAVRGGPAVVLLVRVPLTLLLITELFDIRRKPGQRHPPERRSCAAPTVGPGTIRT
jgi:hypothetical protein